MTAEVLLYHLAEIGCAVSLGASSSELSMDAPKKTLTPELTELFLEHKSELIELVYEREEAAAIEEEGKLSSIGREAFQRRQAPLTVASGVDPALASIALCDEGLRIVAKVFSGLEIISAHRAAQEVAA
jgi:hypothetical protein